MLNQREEMEVRGVVDDLAYKAMDTERQDAENRAKRFKKLSEHFELNIISLSSKLQAERELSGGLRLVLALAEMEINELHTELDAEEMVGDTMARELRYRAENAEAENTILKGCIADAQNRINNGIKAYRELKAENNAYQLAMIENEAEWRAERDIPEDDMVQPMLFPVQEHKLAAGKAVTGLEPLS